MTGTRVPTTGRGVDCPRTNLERMTLKTGSKVLTVWVRLMATAAKDRLAATCPMACMAAGPAIFWNSDLVMGCRGQYSLFTQAFSQTYSQIGTWAKLMQTRRCSAIRSVLHKARVCIHNNTHRQNIKDGRSVATTTTTTSVSAFHNFCSDDEWHVLTLWKEAFLAPKK